jgi:hypothetical protein
MGIGVSFFTEIVGAGPSKNCDILGIAMFDSARSASTRPAAALPAGHQEPGPGPRDDLWAQIIATELGIPADDIMIEEGNTDTAPYGLGTYGSRSTPVAGAAIAMAARKIKAKAQMIAAYMLEVHEDDLEWDVDRFRVKGNPERFKTMKELAWAAYHARCRRAWSRGSRRSSYYDPPNMTFPFGAYICVVDIDVDTGEVKVRRFYALDDCGTRINPMIIEGQIHGGLTEAFAIAMGQEIVTTTTATSPRRLVHGLFPADRRRDAALGDRLHGDAVAASSDRRQGRRRTAAFGGRMMSAVADQVLKQFADNFARLAARRPRNGPDARIRTGPGRCPPRVVPRLGGPAVRSLNGFALIWSVFRAGCARCWAKAGMRPLADPQELVRRLEQSGYIAEPSLAVSLMLMAQLRRPLLVEGDAGVGKTGIAKALAGRLRLRAYPHAVL